MTTKNTKTKTTLESSKYPTLPVRTPAIADNPDREKPTKGKINQLAKPHGNFPNFCKITLPYKNRPPR
jgi:hypothetical protein